MSFLVRLLGLVALGLLLALGWLFRREIMDAVGPAARHLVDRIDRSSGTPDSRALTSARDKVDSLNGWRADSVVLSAAEMVSLLDAGLPHAARRHFDSMRLSLLDGTVSLSARVETGAIPRDRLGPLAGALAPWEPADLAGLFRAAGPGRGEWKVQSLRIRGITLSGTESAKLIGSLAQGDENGVVPFVLPAGIAEFRIRPGGVTLYRERAS